MKKSCLSCTNFGDTPLRSLRFSEVIQLDKIAGKSDEFTIPVNKQYKSKRETPQKQKTLHVSLCTKDMMPFLPCQNKLYFLM